MLSERERDWPTDPADIVGENLVEFHLTYTGRRLYGNSDSNHKHDIRLHFHEQLVSLVNRPGGFRSIRWMTAATVKSGVMVEIPGQIKRGPQTREEGFHYVMLNGVRYVPLISRAQKLRCHLEIAVYRREKPGGIITGADIDARLKTLFDALKIPHSEQEVGSTQAPDPCYCLLEDDPLITKLTVDTRELLRPPAVGEKIDCVDVTIQVDVKAAH